MKAEPSREPAHLRGTRTARHMIDAVTYLIQVARGAGFSSVAHKLGEARAELTIISTGSAASSLLCGAEEREPAAVGIRRSQ